MATIGTQRRHDADNWVGYETGRIPGQTWGKPAPRRTSRTSPAARRVLALTLTPLAVVLVAALSTRWM